MTVSSNDLLAQWPKEDDLPQQPIRPLAPDPDFPPGEAEPHKPQVPVDPEPFDPDISRPHSPIPGSPHVPQKD